ncbi:unnamed protein product [Chondrus crispus]|uniref:Galactosyltransferase C-terminal domain-containing protein n=1 Tax=Chondrus crispus TaxID=2769 RepID=R7QE43_CHOCR|nr:unnamed protein product [Chondrus crispus]CDF36354.1 unnamed protein product [Chondrus crispus]|eukprot:XP_005716173.1 unnamed protein product [Chondrus crispus]
MARAQVCRFYDDGASGAALRRPIKRLPEFQNSSGLFYSAKGRRNPHSSPFFLQIPRTAFLQVLFVLAALFVILTNHNSSPAAPAENTPAAPNGESSAARALANSIGVGSGVAMLNAFASKTLGSSDAADHHPSMSDHAIRISVPEAKVKKGVTLVAVCMGRHDTVKKTAPAWLNVKDVNEIILVDWSSEPPLEPVIRSLPEGERVKVIRVNGETSWVLSRAYNLAVKAATYSHIIRTDCDYQVGEDFVDAHSKLMEHAQSSAVGDTATTGKHFYAGNYNLARNENEVHLNGAVFIRRKDFVDIGGYDERIQTYGWDDEDLYNRLDKAGLKKMNISYDHVSHVKHDDSDRAQSGVKFATVEIDLNSLLLSKLQPWTKESKSATSYRAKEGSVSANSIVIEAEEKPKALRDLVSTERYEEAWAEALGRRLHDSYAVPWDIIANLAIKEKETLLKRLMQRTENRERAKRAELDRAGRTSEIVNVDTLPTPRILICHCMHGLGNRLRALGSCMSFAKEANRELVVVWEPDSHIEAKFFDMFKTPLVVLEKMPVQWPFADVEKWDSVWSQFKFHNYMEMEGSGAVKGEKIFDIPNKHMYYKGAYIMEADNTDLTNWEKDNDMLRSLEPIPEVKTMIADIEGQGLGTDRVIGLHVRNRTLEKDIKNVDFVKEYGDEATQTMDMWRRKSGVQNFIRQINLIIKEKPDVKFFVATDTYEVIGQLEDHYPDRILSFKRSCDDRDGECVKYALADLYALSKCRELYGSNWSSFTEAAERIGNVKAKLAGQDFGV